MTLITITTTVELETQAVELARHLVVNKLAACVQIDGPLRSFYRWQGEVCDSAEYRLTIKTLPEAKEAVLGTLLELHPYDTPEVLVGEVTVAHQPYADWAREQVDLP